MVLHSFRNNYRWVLIKSRTEKGRQRVGRPSPISYAFTVTCDVIASIHEKHDSRLFQIAKNSHFMKVWLTDLRKGGRPSTYHIPNISYGNRFHFWLKLKNVNEWLHADNLLPNPWQLPFVLTLITITFEGLSAFWPESAIHQPKVSELVQRSEVNDVNSFICIQRSEINDVNSFTCTYSKVT